MRFLSIFKSVETGAPPSAEDIGRMQKLIDESIRKGTLVSTEGCLPSVAGARVRLADDKVTVTDGPFVETKEVVGGFAILEASSKEHAIELAKEFLAVAGAGECEIRQLFSGGDCTQTTELQAKLTEQFAAN
jgi:hypothetical protein